MSRSSEANEEGRHPRQGHACGQLVRSSLRRLFHDIKVVVPHPADFALHKLLIAKRRKQKGKAEKDRAQAVALLIALKESGELEAVCSSCRAMPKSWQKTVRQELVSLGEEDLVALIENTKKHRTSALSVRAKSRATQANRSVQRR